MLRRGFTDTYAYIEKEDWNQSPREHFKKLENIHQRKLKEGKSNDKIENYWNLKLYTQVYTIYTSI